MSNETPTPTGQPEEICTHCGIRMTLVTDPTGEREHYHCFPCDEPTPTGGQVELNRFLTRIYNLGYQSGCNATVKGYAVKIDPQDMEECHKFAVERILEEVPQPYALAENAALREEVERLKKCTPTTCPKCGAAEVEAGVPRTVYGCGSSDYDQRPGTFAQTQQCVNNPTTLRAELARLREEKETEKRVLRQDNEAHVQRCYAAEAELSTLRAKIAGLVADKERLDWLDAVMLKSDPCIVMENPETVGVRIKAVNSKGVHVYEHETLRAALDAAKGGEA